MTWVSHTLIAVAGFEPTYEEWKRFFCGKIVRDRFPCFEPTYEEWKLLLLLLWLKSEISFEPTYEEWKQKLSVLKVNLKGRVSSLPMRNGNRSLVVSGTRLCLRFRAYL